MMRKRPFCIVLAALVLAACAGMPANTGDDYRTGSIALINLPQTVKGQPAYKVYVYVTDSMSQHDPHKAQGTALLDGADSINIPLYEPPENYRGKDPDDHGAAWLGTGSYFSVIISPRNVSGTEAILVRGGQALNKPNRECDFKRLMSVSESAFFTGKTEAIYNNIIRADRQGIGSDVITP
jgi:hypothetical protein